MMLGLKDSFYYERFNFKPRKLNSSQYIFVYDPIANIIKAFPFAAFIKIQDLKRSCTNLLVSEKLSEI